MVHMADFRSKLEIPMGYHTHMWMLVPLQACSSIEEGRGACIHVEANLVQSNKTAKNLHTVPVVVL